MVGEWCDNFVSRIRIDSAFLNLDNEVIFDMLCWGCCTREIIRYCDLWTYPYCILTNQTKIIILGNGNITGRFVVNCKGRQIGNCDSLRIFAFRSFSELILIRGYIKCIYVVNYFWDHLSSFELANNTGLHVDDEIILVRPCRESCLCMVIRYLDFRSYPHCVRAKQR